jgi:hypothetical protein
LQKVDEAASLQLESAKNKYIIFIEKPTFLALFDENL